jgi:hypothetical protein
MDHAATAMNSYLDWTWKGHAAIWRYAVVAVLSIVLSFYVAPVFVAVALTILLGAPPALTNVATLIGFVPGLIIIPLLVRVILGRPSWSMALPSWPPDLTVFGAGVAIALVVALIPPPFLQFHYVGFGGFERAGISLVLVTLGGLLLQSLCEEVAFRGILQQSFLRFTGSVWTAIIAQAAIFGWMHISNVASWNSNPLAMAPYFVTAVVWGWVAWRTGSILISWALHFVSNASNVLWMGSKGDDVLQSVAPFAIDTPSIGVGVAAVTILHVVSAVLVEIYVRYFRPQIGLSGGVS